ncbi:MAG TPA: ATP-binding protein [Pyrinomonadaceae bacterium]|nr:ATP-binding protein [Pyrinomonadaceae bacterium]
MNGFETAPEEKGRILIVDDSRLVRSVFLKTLSSGYDCMVAESYEEAMECLRLYPFDLVISDVIMPGLSGTELLRRVVESYANTTVIMVSSVDRPQRALDALRLGAYDYLIKPCELPILELTVERAFAHRKLLNNAAKNKEALKSRNQELEEGKAQLLHLQTQVVQNAKMVALGQIAAGIAHEINNPIGFVHGNLDILNQATASLVELLEFYEAADLPADVASKATEMRATVPYLSSLKNLEEIFADCRDGAERIRDIVQNLKTFSRLDEAEFKKADVNAGLDATVRLLSQYFGNGNITLIRDYHNLPLIDAYGSQINQVWMNLLANAAQAIGEKTGHVRIATSSDSDFVTVTIADSGGGIPNQELGLIFDPFYTTKSVGEGTGLGLSICFGIVERHGGKIFAASELGTGTSFTVRLPICMEKPATIETGLAIYQTPQTNHTYSSYEI